MPPVRNFTCKTCVLHTCVKAHVKHMEITRVKHVKRNMCKWSNEKQHIVMGDFEPPMSGREDSYHWIDVLVFTIWDCP